MLVFKKGKYGKNDILQLKHIIESGYTSITNGCKGCCSYCTRKLVCTDLINLLKYLDTLCDIAEKSETVDKPVETVEQKMSEST